MKDDTISRAAALDFVSAMNFCGEISDEAYQKLTVHFENLPSATDTNVGGNLIDRQAAIDALGERPTVWTDDDDYALGERNQYDMDRLAIETVPSAQLAQDLTKGCTDTISRQAAIDAIERLEIPEDMCVFEILSHIELEIGTLPSAQPELSPCDVCRYYPPSSMDGKLCTICPAERKNNE